MLEGERHAALELAAASKAEVVQLQEAQRRLQWQSQLLEKMSEVSTAVRQCVALFWSSLLQQCLSSSSPLVFYC